MSSRTATTTTGTFPHDCLSPLAVLSGNCHAVTDLKRTRDSGSEGGSSSSDESEEEFSSDAEEDEDDGNDDDDDSGDQGDVRLQPINYSFSDK